MLNAHNVERRLENPYINLIIMTARTAGRIWKLHVPYAYLQTRPLSKNTKIASHA